MMGYYSILSYGVSMFEKILIPLDGSDLAEVALPYAEELMRRLRSQMVLLCVCGENETQDQLLYLEQAVQKIGHRAQRYREKYPEVEFDGPYVETVVLNGKTPEGIIDYVEDNQIDLTIMATHGRSGISRWAMGSVADKVIRGINRPVCLIRARGSHAEVRPDCLVSRIFAPLDGSDAGEAALPYIEALAERLGTEVVLFQSVPKDDRSEDVTWVELEKLAERSAKIYLRKVEGTLVNKGIVVRSEIEFGGNPAQEIIRLAERTRSAVVAMSTHGRSGVDRLMFGSVAEKVLRAGTTPLFLVRAPGADMPRHASYGSRCTVSY